MKLSRTWSLVVLSAVVSNLLCSAGHASPPPGRGYIPVFDDEFTGTTLSSSWWNYNYPWGTYHNGEANMDPSEAFVNNGLTLQAENRRTIWNPWGYWSNDFNKYIPLDYTSGTINTNGKESWHYGYFEGRFKMPSAVSTWPAFWMLQNGWPPELDIFEVQNSRYNDYYTYHYSSNNGPTSFGGVYSSGGDLSAGWHTYGFEWTPNHLNYYVDDDLVQSFYDPGAIAQMNNMYFLIDLQVGGWAPNPNPADYPQQLKCQWVRAWQIGGPPSGNYRLAPMSDPGKSLDVAGYNQGNGASLDLWPATYGENEIFSLLRQNDGSYNIKAYPDWSWDNLILDVPGWNTANGTSMDVWNGGSGDNQRYYLTDEGNHNWRITPKIATGKAVEVNYNAGTVDLWDYWGGSNQLWLLDPPLGPMTLSSIVATNVSDSTATINWTSSYPATSEVDYGLTTAYSYQVTDPATLQGHSIELSGLEPGAEYHYRVVSTDMYGERISSGDQLLSVQWSNLPRVEITSTSVSRLSSQAIQVMVKLANVGTADATNLHILKAFLGGKPVQSISPSGPNTLPRGQNMTFTLVFPPLPGGTKAALMVRLRSSNSLEGVGARISVP